MNTTEREAFEKWWQGLGGMHLAYFTEKTLAWQAWQKRGGSTVSRELADRLAKQLRDCHDFMSTAQMFKDVDWEQREVESALADYSAATKP